jgi:prepilin-type N-terminal cleavage/methylation domain-containing protein
MKRREKNNGLTILEIIVAIAVIAILASGIMTATFRFSDRADEKLAESTIGLLEMALEQFADFGYEYPNPDYAELSFPLDCSYYNVLDVNIIIAEALIIDDTNVVLVGEDKSEYSGIEIMYFFLSRVPECRETLDGIKTSFVTNEDPATIRRSIAIDGWSDPLLRVLDPWGKPLRYDYYDEWLWFGDRDDFNDMIDDRRGFPVITSAGIDGQFGTADDITSR